MTSNNNNNKSKLVAFGSEDLNIIPFEELVNAWKCGSDAVTYLMKLLFVSDKYPQFHNFYVKSVNEKYMIVFDGKEWVTREADETMDELMTRLLRFLLEKYAAQMINGVRMRDFETTAFIRKSQLKHGTLDVTMIGTDDYIAQCVKETNV